MNFNLISFCTVFALLYGETFGMYRSNSEQSDLSQSSSNFSLSSSDSGFSDNISDFGGDDDRITYSTDTTKKPEFVQIPCPDGDRYCEVLHKALCVYSAELDTINPENLDWLKRGRLFPNLERLQVTGNDLSIVAEKDPFEKLKILKVTGSVGNIEELIKTLSATPNLEELTLIDTRIHQRLGRVAGKLIDLKRLKKITLQEKGFAEIPAPLLTLPNIEQIQIDKQIYNRTDIKNERKIQHIEVIDKEDKEKIIQYVKEGLLYEVKQQVKAIDLLGMREELSKIATSAGYADMLEFLINKSVDVNARYEDGNTLLMEAARNNYYDIAKMLINKGADIKAKNKKNETALRLVVKNIEWINSKIHFAQDVAKRNGLIKNKTESIKMVKLLGNNGADLNEKDKLGQSFLYIAMADEDVELVKALLSLSNTENILPTVISSYKNRTPLSNQQINELRDSTLIDVNERSEHTHGKTLLLYAIDRGYKKIVELLLNHGANIEAKKDNGDTALSFAAGHGDPEIIQMLLDRGADINAQNNEGSTPLMNAVSRHHPKTAIFLIDKGADPFIENNEGETALSLAERILEGRWIDSVKDGAKKVIEKIKSHKGYKNFEKLKRINLKR